ncbi:MAG: DUF4870 domain-containing protein [Verrucomicrobiota bacterium]
MEDDLPPTTTKSIKDNTNTMGMLCHLLSLVALLGIPFGNIIGPLVIWLIKREESSFVEDCGKESVNFQISVTLYGVGISLISFPTIIIPFIGFLTMPVAMLALVALFIFTLVQVVIASIKASEGSYYEYPYSIRFIK